MNNFIKNILTVLICLGAAVLFIVLGINQLKARQAYTETTATITAINVTEDISDNEKNYSVEVTYTVDGVEYNGPLGEYNATMDVGEEVQIKYNPENPSEIVTSSYMTVIMYFVMAALAVIAFFCSIIKTFR